MNIAFTCPSSVIIKIEVCFPQVNILQLSCLGRSGIPDEAYYTKVLWADRYIRFHIYHQMDYYSPKVAATQQSMYCYRQALLDIWYIFTIPNKNENPRIQNTQVNLSRALVIMSNLIYILCFISSKRLLSNLDVQSFEYERRT